jgi:hypothetical protein
VSAFDIPVSSSSSRSCGLLAAWGAPFTAGSGARAGSAARGCIGGGAGVLLNATVAVAFLGSCWPGAVGASDIDGSMGRFIASVCVDSSMRCVERSRPGFVDGGCALCGA